MFKRGDIVIHKAADVRCVVLKNTNHAVGKFPDHKNVAMVKCRYFSNGIFHIHEFFPEEIEKE